MMKKDNSLFVVLPAYNEESTVASVADATRSYTDNVVVVDDGSADDTARAAEKHASFVLRHIINLGKGAALNTGCEFAIKKGADKIIVMDADHQHDPSKIPSFLKELESADLVIGCRKFRKRMPFILRMGNLFIYRMTKLLYGIEVTDTQSGYRAFNSAAYEKIRWRSTDYSMESEMIANAAKAGFRIKEIRIPTIYHDKYKGTTVFDGLKIVLNLFRWKLIR